MLTVTGRCNAPKSIVVTREPIAYRAVRACSGNPRAVAGLRSRLSKRGASSSVGASRAQDTHGHMYAHAHVLGCRASDAHEVDDEWQLHSEGRRAQAGGEWQRSRDTEAQRCRGKGQCVCWSVWLVGWGDLRRSGTAFISRSHFTLRHASAMQRRSSLGSSSSVSRPSAKRQRRGSGTFTGRFSRVQVCIQGPSSH